MSNIVTLVAEKQAANAFLQAGQLAKARDAYFAILIEIDSEETRTPNPAQIEIKIACLNNLMALFLKTKKFKEVLELSRQVLQIEANNVKALFRQSQALAELEHNNDALLSLQKILQIEPQNTQAKELLYVVMDKLNPLEEDELPPPPEGEDTINRPECGEGKVYKNTRMATNPTTTSTSSTPLGVEPVPVSFGGGWDFMNPTWKPAGATSETEGDTESKGGDNSTIDEILTLETKQGGIAIGTQVTSNTSSEEKKHNYDDSAQIFLDEAERTRIKNQLFSEALQRNSATTKGQDHSNTKNKIKKKSSKREVSVDEIVNKTVEELSLEEKELVAKVDLKKSSQKSLTKSKKSREESSNSQKPKGNLKKKIVSTKAKS
jgi:tetratricopeptide (TPR) repeat protein